MLSNHYGAQLVPAWFTSPDLDEIGDNLNFLVFQHIRLSEFATMVFEGHRLCNYFKFVIPSRHMGTPTFGVSNISCYTALALAIIEIHSIGPFFLTAIAKGGPWASDCVWQKKNDWWITLSEKSARAGHRAVSLHRGCVLV